MIGSYHNTNRRIKKGIRVKSLIAAIFTASVIFNACKAQSVFTVLKNATVIDCKGKKALEKASIIIKDSLIFAIGKFESLSIPDGSKTIDATGKYIMPGLIDAHAHVTILKTEDGKRVYDRNASESVLKILIEYGITTVRNPAAPTKEGIQLKNDAKNGKIVSPDIYTSGEAIQVCNGRIPDLWETCVATEADVIKEVNRQIDNGVDFIKVYSSMPENILKVIIETAHKRNTAVCGHLGRTSWLKAAQLNIDLFEHATDWNMLMLPSTKRPEYEQLIGKVGAMKARIKWLEWIDPNGKEMSNLMREIKRKNITVDPTLIAYATKFMGNDSLYISNPQMNMVPELVENWKRGTFVDDWSEEDFKEGHKQWTKMLTLIKKYYDANVTMVIGSDLPNPWVLPGVSLYQEMQFFSKAGIPNYDILKMCTANSSKVLKANARIGTIETGKLADIIILDKNPMTDITNVKTIEMVFKKGQRIK